MDTILAQYDYHLAADGKRTGVTERLLVDTDPEPVYEETRVDWHYDAVGRLTREVYDSADDALDFVADYVFDLVGNRVAKNIDKVSTPAALDNYRAGQPMSTQDVDEAITYAYDTNDRLLTEAKDVAGGTEFDRLTEYHYGDSNEKTQQTRKTVKLYTDGSGGTLDVARYRYNRQGRLWIAELDTDGNGDIESRSAYLYDDAGIRVSATETEDADADGSLADETPSTTLFLIDAQNPTGYQQVLEEIESVSRAIVKSYVLGLDLKEANTRD